MTFRGDAKIAYCYRCHRDASDGIGLRLHDGLVYELCRECMAELLAWARTVDCRASDFGHNCRRPKFQPLRKNATRKAARRK
jgi:hypothetical protein